MLRAVIAAMLLSITLCLPTQISFAQTSQPVIILDAGHGGNDLGARGADSEAEKKIALRAVTAMSDVLESQGFTVHLTRTTDTAVSLEQRALIAVDADAALFISVHGAASTSTDLRGLQVFVPPDDEQSRRFAGEFVSAYPTDAAVALTGVRSANFGVFQRLSMPAILIELGYLTHVEEAEVVAGAEHHDLVARTLAQAVRSYLSGS